MQENRLSTIQVVAPTTEQELTSTTEGEVLTTSPSVQFTTETKDLTTNSDAWYNQTETLITVTSTNTEISTNSDMERGDISYKSYFIPSLQVTGYTSITVDDNATISTESLGSTTENSEPTSVKDSTTAEGLNIGTLSVEYDISLSTMAADDPAITSTTEGRFQGSRESDGGLGNHQGTSHDVVSDVREANKQGDENNQGGSGTDEKLLEGDITRSENEDGTLTDGHYLEGVYSQGNVSGSNSEDESKNADDHLQVDNNQSSQKLSIIAGGGDNSYLLHKESPDYGGSEDVAVNYTSDVVTAEATDTPATDGTETSPSKLG
jgi:hypothetical protein